MTWHTGKAHKSLWSAVVQIPTRWQSKHSLQCHVLQSLSFSFVWSLINLHLRFVCGACDRRDCEEIPAGVELRWWCWDSRKPWKIVMKAKMAETDNGWNLYRTLCKSEFQAKARCHKTEGFCCRVNCKPPVILNVTFISKKLFELQIKDQLHGWHINFFTFQRHIKRGYINKRQGGTHRHEYNEKVPWGLPGFWETPRTTGPRISSRAGRLMFVQIGVSKIFSLSNIEVQAPDSRHFNMWKGS